MKFLLVFLAVVASAQIPAPGGNSGGGTPAQLAAASSVGAAVAGAATNGLTINLGDANFSQGGLKYCSGATPTCEWGWFTNYDGVNYIFAMFDYIGGNDKIEGWQGAAGKVWIQPVSGGGFTGVGPQAGSTPELLSIGGGNFAVFDGSLLGSESLTNGALTSGTSWTQTNDCALTANAATCTFSAGTLSTIQQASGTLAVAGKSNRIYKFTYDASAITGTPTVSISGLFCNAATGNTCGLTKAADFRLQSGNGQVIYFRSVAATTNFVIQTTLTTGQAFTLDNLSLKEVVGGNEYLGGKLNLGDCISTAGTCGSYPSGSVTIAAAATTVVVSTTQVTSNSTIILTPDQSLGTKLGVTCNTQTTAALGSVRVSARNPGTSFTALLDVAPTTNPYCFGYQILN